MKILIIDDVIDNIKLMVSVFEKHLPDYEIFQTNNPLKAADIARQTMPDLIITDWNMPEISGIELIKDLKSKDDLKDIPVIMATGIMLSNKDLQTALKAGAIDYLRKPIDETELIARTNSALKLTRYYKQLVHQKNKELAESSLQLVKNQEFVGNIITKIDSVIAITGRQPYDATLKLVELKKEIKDAIDEDSWYRFNLSFSEVHSEFNKNLTSKHPDLTPSELKLCTFIKLGMANKEIASVLNQSPDSIKTSRYRLRKKLSLDGVNLETYIAGF